MDIKKFLFCLASLMFCLNTHATRNLKNGLATNPKIESCRKNNQENGLSKKELKLIMRRLRDAQEQAQKTTQLESEQDSETE